jgi:hypothetical protein
MGIGSSHSPALLMEPPAWLARGGSDDRTLHALHDHTGKLVKYEELLAVTPDAMLKEIEPDLMQERHLANEAAMNRVSDILLEADPDIVIIIGDDHKEVYQEDNMPALAVYWGDTLPYRPQGVMKWRYADDLKTELWYPQEDKDYPVAGAFAKRLITDLCNLGFDPAHSQRYLDGQGMSHSFGYVYHRIMTEKVFPIIPVNINTYYPPNQVTPLRAYQIGQAIRQAVEAWPEDLRVVVMATGGLSHFVVDEDFDRAYIEILKTGGAAEHAAIPLEKLQSGNSEFRCWSVLAGALEDKAFNLIDYVPCYRSPAGTGCAMAFGYWE